MGARGNLKPDQTQGWTGDPDKFWSELGWATPSGGGGGGGDFALLDSDVAAGSVASLEVASWLSGSYDNYAIKISGVVPSGGCILQMDFSTDGGSTWENSNYNWLWVYGVTSSGVIRNASDSQINFRDVNSTLDAGGSFNAKFDLMRPGFSGSKQIIGQITAITNSSSAPGLIVLSGGAFWAGSGAVNGIRVKPSAGTILNGSLRIYGYGN